MNSTKKKVRVSQLIRKNLVKFDDQEKRLDVIANRRNLDAVANRISAFALRMGLNATRIHANVYLDRARILICDTFTMKRKFDAIV